MEHLRSERAGKRRRQSFTPRLFDRINGLVKEFALGETFLKSLDTFADQLREEHLAFDRVKPKRPYEPPLFSLSTEEEYRVTLAIINRAANPYLNFVSSPDEILLCESLFRHNPSLPAERLARFHFEALLMAEIAKTHLLRLTEQIGCLRGMQAPGTADGSPLFLLQARCERLRMFVARLEEAGGS